MNYVDIPILILILVGGYLGLRWGRSLFHLLVILAAVFFSLCVTSYFTYGALRLFPMLANNYAAVLVILALFALPLTTLFKTGTLDRVELNFRWQPPLWLNVCGGALAAVVTVALGLALIIECFALFLLGGFLIFGCSGPGGVAWSVITSGFARGSYVFIGWLAQTPGLVFFIILGIAFIVLAIRGPRVSEGPILKAAVDETMSEREAERARKFFGDEVFRGSGPGTGTPGPSPIDPAAAAGGMAAGGFSTREYYERKAREQTAPGPADVPPPPPPPPPPPVEPADVAAPETPPSPPPPPAPAPAVPTLQTGAQQPDADDTSPLAEHLRRAATFEKSGAYGKAIEEYTAVIELDSAHAAACLSRGQILMMQGKKDEAAADFQRVIEISDNPELVSAAQARLGQMK